jgi:hypothetical protein
MSIENVKDLVRDKYGEAALRVISVAGSCCGDRGSAQEASTDLRRDLRGGASVLDDRRRVLG